MPGAPVVIRLELARAIDMFEPPEIVLGAQHGSSIPGIDRCLAELTATKADRPVQLDLVLPEADVAADVGPKITTSLRCWCEEHRHYNEALVRAMKHNGWQALRIGLPITVLGLIIVAIGGNASDNDQVLNVVDILGWVLAWLGLWYPFDKVIFYPRDLIRENRALVALRDATVTVTAAPPATEVTA
jgi:hypothetical protein